jgi:hypothetical protein
VIGLATDNISIILQLASCSPPALPGAPHWLAICIPSCRLSISLNLFYSASDSMGLPHATQARFPRPKNHEENALNAGANENSR